ncbi:D123 family protein [Acanthamoeba polyphaga moumouvirus]|uniref:D123 family protein n=1 Tax=Acanthamoeba polyphaga moumouvirus TaxID=1269028 RepID=L7RFM7_9VIRU|nr:D123 family protein [Acanthamoeba polyphaga moumouvirus]AGC01610.1 D123 family protein [Acanthamoeba polyphaga moumouvirus]AQN67935.1 D123 family protein [Saudi moumouvirus]
MDLTETLFTDNYSPYIKISENDKYSFYKYPESYLELFLDELFYDKSIVVNDDCTFKMSIDEYIIDKNGNETDVDFEYLRQAQISVYWVSNWYDYLMDNVKDVMITFKSHLIHLSEEDIFNLFNYKDKNIIPFNLVKEISNIILELGGSAFIRTDAYSPKDLLYNHTVSTLKVTNAIDALQLVTKSTRCCSKLFDINNKIISKYLVLRQYIDYDTNYEFRCFIYGWKLRAISQAGFEYNPQLHEKKKKIYDLILKFWDKFSRICPFSECTMDIVYNEKWIDNTLGNSGIIIIEFNSFGPHMNACSGLYNWVRDYYILTQSEKPHFVLAEKPLNFI